MKQSKIIILFLFISQFVFAQEEKKPVALVFNNGLGAASVNFKYLESLEVNAPTLELASSASSPYVANPGIRFYTKRGFHEIGFNNILLGGRGELFFDGSGDPLDGKFLNVFSSSLYFNKSYRLSTTKDGEILVGLEPTFHYSTLSNGIQRAYQYVGRNIGGDVKLMLRWDHHFTENMFIGIIGGVSTFRSNYQIVQHNLTNADETIYLSEFRFDMRFSQIVQVTFGIKI
jgi:hypothetical protein